MQADDFARSAVSSHKLVSGVHLALIIVGGTIGFAIFVIASQIGASLGYFYAALAFAIGSLALGVMGAVTSYVGSRSRLSSYLLAEFAFGALGAKLTNFIVALSLVGWFAVISHTLGWVTQQMLSHSFGLEVPTEVTITIGSFLIIFVTASGFTGIDRLALYLTPLMAAFILFAAVKAMSAGDGSAALVTDSPLSFYAAISAVIGSYIVGVIIQPDYSRFAKNNRHAIWSVFLALAVGFTVVQFFSAVPAMEKGSANLVLVMAGLGLVLPAFFLLFFGAWSSNVLSLYSASLSMATIWGETSPSLAKLVVGLGLVGTLLAYFMNLDLVIQYLVLLGISIPPIGAIYTIEAVFVRKFRMDLEQIKNAPGINVRAFLAWGLAIAAGYLSHIEAFGVFGVAALDSLLVASVAYAALCYKQTFAAGRLPVTGGAGEQSSHVG